MKTTASKLGKQTAKIRQHNCPVCCNSEIVSFFRIDNVPVFCNVLWETREKAVAAPRSLVHLAYCDKCGLIYNLDFDNKLTEYSDAYENSLHFSQRFRQWAQQTAERLVQKYQLSGKDIIEIGSGQGDFLAILQRLGNNRVLGFDPSYNSNKLVDLENPDVKIIPRAYSETFSDCPADFICCRHVLEHIQYPLEFLKNIRTTIGQRKNCVVYFEVPNALYSFEKKGLWDIIYEHCSYFTSKSLAGLFLRAGFEPIEIAERYDGQFLTIEAQPAHDNENPVLNQEWVIPNIRQLINDFQNVYWQKVNSWQKTLDGLEKQKESVIIWGAGSKGITFVNALNISHEQIEYIVDINPRKHGKFAPVTGQCIIGPEFLKECQPRTIIIMNIIYSDEIKETVRELGLVTNYLFA